MRHKRDFWILAALVTALFIGAQSPRLGRVDHWSTSTPWEYGWPATYEVWVEHPDGDTSRLSFDRRAVLVNVTTWYWLLVVVWLLTWPWPRWFRSRPQAITSLAGAAPPSA
jgi:hypothetical protein